LGSRQWLGLADTGDIKARDGYHRGLLSESKLVNYSLSLPIASETETRLPYAYSLFV
jgi:hypothetical protein